MEEEIERIILQLRESIFNPKTVIVPLVWKIVKGMFIYLMSINISNH